jgi:hypothetical protein
MIILESLLLSEKEFKAIIKSLKDKDGVSRNIICRSCKLYDFTVSFLEELYGLKEESFPFEFIRFDSCEIKLGLKEKLNLVRELVESINVNGNRGNQFNAVTEEELDYSKKEIKSIHL